MINRAVLFAAIASLGSASSAFADEPDAPAPHAPDTHADDSILGTEAEGLARLLALEAEWLEARSAESSDVATEAAPWITQGWELPAIPVTWDANVERFVRYFKDDRRGRALYQAWLTRMGTYGAGMRAEFAAQGLPEDLVYVAMIESSFAPTARSQVGAVGLWQFMPSTGEGYGLRQSHWIDERMQPELSTHAAAQFLGDLHTRFRSWELALAAYNMGYGALIRSVRKYNTNDFWTLSRQEAGLPYETTLYVAKILACALIGKNADRAGFRHAADAAAPEMVTVPGALALSTIARAFGVQASEIKRQNPQLLRTFTPPDLAEVSLRFTPHDSSATRRRGTTTPRTRERSSARRVRFGETLEDIATEYGVQKSVLARLNEVASEGRLSHSLTLVLPSDASPRARSENPVAVTVPARDFTGTADRARVFYRAIEGDTLRDLARFFEVSTDELRRWNDLDSRAVLQQGMYVQMFLPQTFDQTRARLLSARDVRLLVSGSDEFFAYHESQRGRVRTTYTVTAGDTLESLARRFDLSVGSLCRINQFNARTTLSAGQSIIVYAPQALVEAAPVSPEAATPAEAAASAPTQDASSVAAEETRAACRARPFA
jgi:membrane-bound lytic murein transglycosylase D